MPANRRQAERREVRLRGAGTRKVNSSAFAITFGTPKLRTPSSKKRSAQSKTRSNAKRRRQVEETPVPESSKTAEIPPTLAEEKLPPQNELPENELQADELPNDNGKDNELPEKLPAESELLTENQSNGLSENEIPRELLTGNKLPKSKSKKPKVKPKDKPKDTSKGLPNAIRQTPESNSPASRTRAKRPSIETNQQRQKSSPANSTSAKTRSEISPDIENTENSKHTDNTQSIENTQTFDDQWSDSSEWAESRIAKVANKATRARSHQKSTRAARPKTKPTKQPIASGANTAPAASENRINAVDMVLQRVVEKFDEFNKDLKAGDSGDSGAPTPPPWKARTLSRYRAIVEARLRELAGAIDVNSTMAQALRRAEQKRNSLRSQLLDVRSAKLQLQQDMQRVRDEYQQSKQTAHELTQVSEFATTVQSFNALRPAAGNSAPRDLHSLSAQLLLLQPVLGDNGALSRLRSLREKLSRLDRALK